MFGFIGHRKTVVPFFPPVEWELDLVEDGVHFHLLLFVD